MGWSVLCNRDLTMTVKDFGVGLPFLIDVGTDLGASDIIKFTFKKNVGGEDLIVKEFSEIVDNTVELVFTAEESDILPVGSYVYRLDWYQQGQFMDCLIEVASFKVVRKA